MFLPGSTESRANTNNIAQWVAIFDRFSCLKFFFLLQSPRKFPRAATAMLAEEKLLIIISLSKSTLGCWFCSLLRAVLLSLEKYRKLLDGCQ